MVDLLTDSGTGAMSSIQTACLTSGDESYAGSKLCYNLEESVKDLTNFQFVYPVQHVQAIKSCSE